MTVVGQHMSFVKRKGGGDLCRVPALREEGGGNGIRTDKQKQEGGERSLWHRRHIKHAVLVML